MSNDKVITAEKLSKRFGDFAAVDGISFDVHKGEIFGFLGANGAGKTTAMRMLCGLSIPTSGQATVAGFDVYKQTEQIKKNIGLVSKNFGSCVIKTEIFIKNLIPDFIVLVVRVLKLRKI